MQTPFPGPVHTPPRSPAKPVGVVEWDSSARVINWSSTATSIFEYTTPEAAGRKAEGLILWENERSDFAEFWAMVFDRQTAARMVFLCRTRSGRRLICEWFGSVRLDSSGAPSGVVCLVDDVTERLALEAVVQQGTRFEAMGRLAAGVAHEFNNLLAPIVIEVERIADRPDEPERIAAHVTALRLALAQARELTERTLLIAGRTLEGREWVELAELVESTVGHFREELDPRIRISTSLDRSLPPVLASRTAVVQILSQLIFNACDAFPAARENAGNPAAPTISISTYRSAQPLPPDEGRGASAGFQVLALADNGPGLDAAARARAFEPFFTTKSPGSGHGLGLALVWRLAQNHHGWVELQSEKGTGCVLRVFLPEGSIEKTCPPDRSTIALASGSGTRRPGLLLVEDNLLVANALTGVLEDCGYRVFSAETGERGWEWLSEEGPSIHLALCDMNLPGISGRELLERVQKSARPIPVIMMSGYLSTEDTEELNRLGVAALISKPIDPHELRQIVTGIAPLPA